MLAMLKDLRKSMSHRIGLQPWIIFGDPALEDMSINYPVTLKELQNCQGVGEGKANKFGKEFVALIAKYVEENEIERPDDFVLRSSPAKSTGKVTIIQNIDRQMDLEDIASAAGMDMAGLMDEIEGIVASGFKLHLDYYIERNIDPEVVEEILDWFKDEAASDSLEDALNELGSDYEEMEVRLVRIKFLCEVAS